jgi:hypothetical protein
LHAHRASRRRARQQCRVERHIVSAIVAITTRAFHVMYHHILRRYAQRRRHFGVQRKDALTVRPHGIFSGIANRHRARWRQRGMRQEMARKFGFQRGAACGCGG